MRLAYFLGLVLAVFLPASGYALDPSLIYGDAFISAWQRPAYPPALIEEKRQGYAIVRFVVDEHGDVAKARVLKSFDPRADEPALEAVRHWKFRPATAAGQPVASCMNARVAFRLKNLKEKSLPLIPLGPEMPRAAETNQPEALEQPDADFPPELFNSYSKGEVRLELDIDSQGKVSQARVVQATDPAFAKSALAVMPRWRFQPAMQGDLPVPATIQSRMLFSRSWESLPVPR